MFALVLLTLLAASTFMQAQEVTYNTTPTHELGPELWQLPIGGQLTMSRDGKTLLVASMADTCFYVVDVASGKLRLRLSTQYLVQATGGFTSYSVDNDISWLGVSSLQFNVDPLQEDVMVIDLTNGDTVSHSRSKVHVAALSRIKNRMLLGGALVGATSLDTIYKYAEEAFTTGWFDDDRGMLYRCVPNGVQEIDATTGVILRGWGTNARAFSRAIRPQNSMWLYVFAWPESDQPESTFVDAIHLETGERVHYTHLFEGGGPTGMETTENAYAYATSSIAMMCAKSAIGYNYLCSFNGDASASQAIVSPLFKWGTRTSTKENVVNPELSLYLHTWGSDTRNPDSNIIRCNALSPTTSVRSSDSTSGSPLKVIVEADILRIIEPQLELAISLDIIATDGRILQHHSGDELVRQPIAISIAALSSGTYLCAVQLAERRLTTLFPVVR